jgi:hypothetical protein
LKEKTPRGRRQDRLHFGPMPPRVAALALGVQFRDAPLDLLEPAVFFGGHDRTGMVFFAALTSALLGTTPGAHERCTRIRAMLDARRMNRERPHVGNHGSMRQIVAVVSESCNANFVRGR